MMQKKFLELLLPCEGYLLQVSLLSFSSTYYYYTHQSAELNYTRLSGNGQEQANFPTYIQDS